MPDADKSLESGRAMSAVKESGRPMSKDQCSAKDVRTEEGLPSFERPPVLETVLGVQFEPLRSLTSAYLGAFWKSLGSNWVPVEDAPAIEPQFEQFGIGPSWGSVRLSFGQMPGIRLRIRSKAKAKSRMIQVQNGRFHYNWVGVGKDYPRYSQIRQEFDKELKAFENFLREESLGEIKPNQWEVTYVNHIPRRTTWETPAEWGPRVLPGLLGCFPESNEVAAESFGGQWHYEIKPQRGRLHIELRHMKPESPDAPDLLIMKLTARGPIGTAEEGGPTLDQGLDLGREAIVRAFKELTSPEAHEYWGLKR